jgi:RNA polymerase sigma-70 factor (ECF subfamily)
MRTGVLIAGRFEQTTHVRDLVRAARAGDRAAFGKLHDGHARMVHAILVARVPVAEADDLVQDVFLAAMQKLGELRDDDAFGGWLAQIARNRAKDHLRGRKTLVELPEDLAGRGARPAEAAQVLAAIRALPEAYAETIAMRLIEGMTGPEIAERTGLTPASVRVNLHRGMKILRERLGVGVEDDE